MNTGTQYISTSQAPTLNAGGALFQFLASEVILGENTLDVVIAVLPPCVFVPLHSHRGAELFFTMDGELEAYAGDENGGEWRTVGAGELVVIPGAVRHAWNNRSNTPARVLSFAGNSIFEIIKKLAVPVDQVQAVAPPMAAFLQELQEIESKSGTWLATPEENAAVGLRF